MITFHHTVSSKRASAKTKANGSSKLKTHKNITIAQSMMIQFILRTTFFSSLQVHLAFGSNPCLFSHSALGS